VDGRDKPGHDDLHRFANILKKLNAFAARL
jgi:hypothetical protein